MSEIIDVMIECRDCHKTFAISQEHMKWFQEKGVTPFSRCKECRAKNKKTKKKQNPCHGCENAESFEHAQNCENDDDLKVHQCMSCSRHYKDHYKKKVTTDATI